MILLLVTSLSSLHSHVLTHTADYNIKRLQVDQHRAWMLRTFIWMGSIITLRIIMILSALITTMIGSYYHYWTCDEIAFARGSNNLRDKYPECLQNNRPGKHVAVYADFSGGKVEEVGAALQISFGMAVSIIQKASSLLPNQD